MLGLAGLPLGLGFRFLDPSPDAPAREVGELVVGAFDDPAALGGLAAGADVVTYEFENVPGRGRPRRLAPLPPPARARAGPGPARREGAVPAARDPDGALRLARRTPGCPRSSSPGGSATTARASGASRPREPVGEDELAEEIVALRPRALDPRRARPGRRDAVLAAGRERPPRRDPARLAGAGGRAPAGRGGGARDAAARRARLRRRARARAVRGRRPAARERVRAARPQHRPLDDRRRRHEPVREPPARDPRPAARLDRRARAVGDGQPDRRVAAARRSCSRSPAPTSTSTARSRAAAASSGTSRSSAASEETVGEAIELVEAAADG